jgi:predicted HTH domain antitoxin
LIVKPLAINLPEEVEIYRVKMIIAASLFEQGILSSGQATELVGISRRQFLEEVGKYGMSILGETAEDLEKMAGIEP